MVRKTTSLSRWRAAASTPPLFNRILALWTESSTSSTASSAFQRRRSSRNCDQMESWGSFLFLFLVLLRDILTNCAVVGFPFIYYCINRLPLLLQQNAPAHHPRRLPRTHASVQGSLQPEHPAEIHIPRAERRSLGDDSSHDGLCLQETIHGRILLQRKDIILLGIQFRID